MIRFSCTQCGKKFKAPEKIAGRTVACSSCGAKLTVPFPFLNEPAEEKEDAGRSEPVTFKLEKKPVFEDLVDMTAMVDIVFFLLIFFMVTSMQGLYSTISVPPPAAEKSSATVKRNVSDYENDAEYVVVRIDRDNNMLIENTKILSEQDLRIKLRNARQGSKGTPPMKKLLVLANPDAYTMNIVKVIDAGNDVGMEGVQLALDEAE